VRVILCFGAIVKAAFGEIGMVRFGSCAGEDRRTLNEEDEISIAR